MKDPVTGWRAESAREAAESGETDASTRHRDGLGDGFSRPVTGCDPFSGYFRRNFSPHAEVPEKPVTTRHPSPNPSPGSWWQVPTSLVSLDSDAQRELVLDHLPIFDEDATAECHYGRRQLVTRGRQPESKWSVRARPMEDSRGGEA